MPLNVYEPDESLMIAELQAEVRRLRRASGASQNDVWKFDTFTITGSGDTTHTLSFIPKGINVTLLNKSGLTEPTDYTCDYTTGIITVLTAVAAGNVLHVRYVTTGELMVYSTAADIGTSFADNFNRADASTLGAPWVVTNEAGATTPAAFGIDTNRAKPITSLDASTNVLAYVDISDSDMDLSYTLAAVGNNSAGAFRIKPSTRAYWYLYYGSGPILAHRSGAGFDGLTHSLPSSAAAGDVIRVVASGTTITVYKNGVSQLVVTDTFGTSGATAAGLAGIPASDTTTRFDDFSVTGL